MADYATAPAVSAAMGAVAAAHPLSPSAEDHHHGDSGSAAAAAAAALNNKFRQRACARCSRSKLRCIRRADPGVAPCDRCARLGADCILPDAKPRGPKKGQARAADGSSRVGQLEQKLDGIMSLLTASQQLLGHSSSSGSPGPGPGHTPSSTGVGGGRSEGSPLDHRSPPESATSRLAALANGCAEAANGSVTLPPIFPPRHDFPPSRSGQQDFIPVTPESIAGGPGVGGGGSGGGGPNQRHPDAASPAMQRKPSLTPAEAGAVGPRSLDSVIEICPGLELTWREAQSALESYRNYYVQTFPFTPVPDHFTPYDLYDTSPLLFRVIMYTCAQQSGAQQKRSEKWFRSCIAEQLVVNSEKKIEILQCLLILLGWGDFRFYIDSKVTPLLQLAVGLVIDLGIHKPPIPHTLTPYSLLNEAFKRYPHLRGKPTHSREDMRAMLGCFYIVTLISCLFRHMHHFPYTDYVEKCCQTLLETTEFETDVLLVTMVRQQALVRRVQSLFPAAIPDCLTGEGRQTYYNEPVAIVLASARRELEESMGVRSHPLIMRMHYQACLVAIHEPVIYMQSPPPPSHPSHYSLQISGLLPSPHSHSSSSDSSSTPTNGRTEALWRCLEALGVFQDMYAEVPTERLGCMSLLPHTYMAFGFVTLTRLLFLEDQDWDAAVARSRFDFPAKAARMTERYASADAFEADHAARGIPLPYKRKYLEDGSPIVNTFVQKCRWIRQWFLSRTHAAQGGASAGAGAGAGGMVVDASPCNTIAAATALAATATVPHQKQQQQQQQDMDRKACYDGGQYRDLHPDCQSPRQTFPGLGPPSVKQLMQTQSPHQQQQQHQQQTMHAVGGGALQQQQQPGGDSMMLDYDAIMGDMDESFWHAFLALDTHNGVWDPRLGQV